MRSSLGEGALRTQRYDPSWLKLVHAVLDGVDGLAEIVGQRSVAARSAARPGSRWCGDEGPMDPPPPFVLLSHIGALNVTEDQYASRN